MLSINLKNTLIECENYCNGFTDGKIKIKGIVSWIEKRVNNYLSIENLSFRENDASRDLLLELKTLLTRRKIEEIIKCDCNDLQAKGLEYERFDDLNIVCKIDDNENKRPTNVLNLIFNYSEFRNYKKTIYNGFLLSERLAIECCPYCNRNYTTSHQTYFINKNGIPAEKHVFPEFDHFYPKAQFPVLALSFYNLIPSCNICNTHYKNDRDPSHLFHPYSICDLNNFKFVGFPNNVESLYGSDNNISIGFEFFGTQEINEKLSNSIDFFGIKDIYEKCHTPLIKEIIHKKIAFSTRYIENLKRSYGLAFEDSYKILFESYYEDEMIYKRPFSKLKKDIFTSDL